MLQSRSKKKNNRKPTKLPVVIFSRPPPKRNAPLLWLVQVLQPPAACSFIDAQLVEGAVTNYWLDRKRDHFMIILLQRIYLFFLCCFVHHILLGVPI